MIELTKRLHIPGDIDKEPELRDKVMILAYLEELATLGSAVQLTWGDPLAPPLQARVERVTEEKRTLELILSRALPGQFRSKDSLVLEFPLDGQRFQADVAFLERSGFLRAVFAFPNTVKHGERRTLPRARFGPREKANVTLLEGLFEGHGATGRLVNLSLGGAAIRVDRAIAVQGQRRLNVTPELFGSGARLDFVRIQDLPHIPFLECKGQVMHMERSPIGITLGLRFQDLDPLDAQLLNQVIHQRVPDQGHGFPIKYPKSRRQLEPEKSSDPGTEEVWEDLTEEAAPAAPEAPAPRADSKERLLAIKKRGKRILLIMLDDMDRAILSGTLQVAGFTRMGEARNYLDALAWLKVTMPDLVIVDHHVGMHTGQQIIEKLRSQGFLEQVPILMLAQAGDVRALLQAKASRMDRVIRYPIDFDGEMHPALLELLGL